MSFTKASSLLAAAAVIAQVSAHGIVQGIVADGVYYTGYNPGFQYENPPPVLAGWSVPEDTSWGFVNDYSSPDIVCHKGATAGGAYVTVAAGDTVELQWTPWPVLHKGPMMDYLASCNGDCQTIDKTTLLFNKIDEAGLINGSPEPGTWASDTMIANNNSWTVIIPPTIAPGKYVLRHETIALHMALNMDGSQAYPQCINLEITGSGTNTLSTGTRAQDFYKDTDPGLFVNIYFPALTNYTIPGPPLMVGAVSAAQPNGSASGNSTTPTSKPSFPTLGPYANSTAPTSKPSFPMLGPYANSTTASNSTTPSASASGIEPSTLAGAAYTVLSFLTAAVPSYPAPISSAAVPSFTASLPNAAGPAVDPAFSLIDSPVATSASTPTSHGISFTSTFTGRFGKPTKFTCYVDED